MPYNEIRSILSKLHKELDETEQLTPASERLLRESLAEIQEALDSKPAPKPLVITPVESAIVEFENSHPKIAQLGRQLVQSCTNLGL